MASHSGNWGASGRQVIVEHPDPSDPPFMQTVAPSGTTWGQYVRTGSSFVDPQTGFLAGPWAECIAWGVVFEKGNDWGNMPQYAADGPIGGILVALEQSLNGQNNKQQVMAAAQKLEDASHEMADNGQALPAINQVVRLPQNAVPGQPCRIENPQTPGTYMNIQVPPNAQPGQQISAPAPCQPNKGGGMSTGGKVALVAGGAVVAGGAAAAIYYGTTGGGVDGFVGDMGSAAGAIGDVAGDAGDMAGDFGGDVGDWAGDSGGDLVDFGDSAGDSIMDLF